MLALLGGKAEPARAIAEIIPRRAGAPEIEPGQIVLRVGIAEIGRGVREHLPRPLRIGLDLRIGNAVEIIPPQRDKGVGNDRRLRRRRAIFRVGIGDTAEILERPKIISSDAIAVCIHPPQFPLGDGVTAFGGVLQRGQRRVRRGRRDHLLQGRGRPGLG